MTTVTPDRILKEMQQLWIDIGKTAMEPGVKGEHGILRACAMTLVIAADEEEETADIGETIAELMHHHPSRAIVLRVRDGGDEFLESRVYAQCWRPFGRRQQICCEQIEIRSSEASLRDIPRIVLGLMVPDLPVVLVCRSALWFGSNSFAPLLRVANRIILDTRRAPHPVQTMTQLEAAHQQGLRVSDLAWTAITEWRRHIAALFDDATLLARLREVHHIRVTTGSMGASAEAWYLAAWLQRSAGVQAGVSFTTGTSTNSIHAVDLKGDAFSLSLQRGEGSVLAILRDGLAASVSFALSSDWELLREELSITGDDRVYHAVLPRAIALAAAGR
ncbi:MAG: glucose-6-phosphate dehydrogenase assembly protein OpcA [Acidobacteria bacterium]|nr:glucose-6-phosphate dehydrogenase assembly protein OpcA [Acidobacteriota bacterium]